MKKGFGKRRAPQAIWYILLVTGVTALFILSLNRLSSGQAEEHKRQLEDSLRLAAVSCFASEGFYPPDLAYLEDNYGIQIDHDRYTVFYEVFAVNLMPDITVLEVDQGS